MSLKDRFGALERRRPTHARPAARLEQRFGTLGDAERAQPPPPATALPADEVRARSASHAAAAGDSLPPPAREDRLVRLLALALAAWAGHRLLRFAARMLATAVVLALLVLLLGAGVLGRGCAVLRGELPPGAVIR